MRSLAHATPRALQHTCAALVLAATVPVGTLDAQTGGQRPMTFLDVRHLRQASTPELSPDGKWALYSLSVPNWKEAKSFSDIYVVSAERGLASTRQLTFTKDKNETNPRWTRDGAYFVFASNRDAPNNGNQQQIYVMRPDGGEAMKVTDAKDGVGQFAFTRDGRWLIFSSGKPDEVQIWALPAGGLDTAKAVQLTKHATPIRSWQLSNDGQRLFFTAPDSLDKDDKTRREKQFSVNVRNQAMPPEHLWVFDLGTRQEKRLTSDASFSVNNYRLSPDGKWVGVSGIKNDRYARNITEQGINGDLYLVDVTTGESERLTNNADIGESPLFFSPDGEWIAFTAANDMKYFRDGKLYLRRRAEKGGQWRKLGNTYDGGVGAGWWSKDGKTIYFSDGVKATTQLMALDVEKDVVKQVTDMKAVFNAARDEDTGLIQISYADPKTPATHFVAAEGDVANKSAWRQLTNANPQVASFTLGEAEEITWKSKDGKMVGGVLVKPVGYQPGKKYPLVVAIHGGPAAADQLGFNGGYGSQIYAGAGYAVLMPNYRGSTNYGEKHRLDIVGNYFQKGYEDIITGVDHLIAQGIAHPDSLGAFGWSAGGHWSNWILVSTNRFKAISSGAGTSNWISMYAQSDVQRNRQEYLGGKLPYDDFEAYWRVSPLKYIKNAKTPTMIHVVDGDPRVPRPQSEELHMALKKLGVPTEFYVYPGSTHGITEPRNQLLKSVAEFAWFEHWIRGKPQFTWKDVLKTLEEETPTSKVAGTTQ